jgi:CHAT domain-containing protein
MARRSAAEEPFVGFGDPVFEGEAGDTRGLSAELVYRNGTEVDLRALRQLRPLPDSRDELGAPAAALGAGGDALFLGPRAREREVKSADLGRYRVVAMATHGFLSGEFPGLAEPALAFTPPPAPSAEDDGLLTAGEVAGLALDADLVILSACNTAAPAGESGAEGLSGLARAFFYAGSRALYVSHWYVDSRAAALVTTASVQRLEAGAGLGAAEALRQSMLGLLAGEQGPVFRHPVFWAPFVTVGEGAA